MTERVSNVYYFGGDRPQSGYSTGRRTGGGEEDMVVC